MKTQLNCPEISEIERFLSDSLTPEQDKKLDHHLSNCPTCQKLMDQFDVLKVESCVGLSYSILAAQQAASGTTSKAPVGKLPKFQDVELIEKIGGGGFGDVYLGHQTNANNRLVAVKVLRQGAVSVENTQLFKQEINSLSDVAHVNISQIYQTCVADDGTVGIVMEYIEGQTLSDFAADHSVSLESRLKIANLICIAVQFIHEIPIIHRDLKPNNILVTHCNGEFIPKIIDFGLSVAQHRFHPLFFRAAGTPKFMAPEQAGFGSERVSEKSDIYSLGLCLHELLSGKKSRVSFPGESTQHYFERKFSHRFCLPSLSQSSIANKKNTRVGLEDIDAILAKATSLEVANRYQTITQLRLDLEAVLQQRPISLRKSEYAYRGRLFAKRNRFKLVTAASLILIAIATVVFTIDTRAQADRAIKESGEFAKKLLDGANPVISQESAKFDNNDVIDLADLVGNEAESLDFRASDTFISARMTAANTLLALGEAKLAIGNLETIVADCVERFGSEADDTVAAKASLAKAYLITNRLQDANNIFLDGLRIFKRKYGINHTKTLAMAHYVSYLQFLGGYYKEAIEISDEIISRYQLDLESPDLLLAEVRMVRGRSYSKLKQFDKAILDYQFASEQHLQAGLWESHPQLILIKIDIAFAMQGKGECAEAIVLFEWIIKQSASVFPKGALAIDEAKFNFGVTLINCGRTSEGINILKDLAKVSAHEELTERIASELKRVQSL